MNLEKSKRFAKAVGISLAVFALMYVPTKILNNNGYHLGANISNSLPGSVYLAKNGPVDTNLKKGDLVMFKLPVDVPKSYVFKRGDIFMKQIACVPGDVVSITESKYSYTYSCNNYPVATALKFDKYKNSLPHPSISGAIPDDYYFVTTPHPKSFDSRYYGLIKRADFIGRAESLF